MIIVSIICFLLGLIGTLIPFLPGPILVWGGVFLYGWAEGFVNIGPSHLLGQGVLLGLIFLVDWVSSFIGVKKAGGSKYSLWGAVFGLIMGLFFLGPLGIIVGPPLGAFLIEFISRGDLEKALRISLGSLLGFLGGTVVKLIIELVMIVWFFMVI